MGGEKEQKKKKERLVPDGDASAYTYKNKYIR